MLIIFLYADKSLGITTARKSAATTLPLRSRFHEWHQEESLILHVIKTQMGLIPIGRDPDSGLWEFAHLQTGSIPERSQEGNLILTEDMGLVFVLVPGGTFQMGAERPSLGIHLQNLAGAPFPDAKGTPFAYGRSPGQDGTRYLGGDPGEWKEVFRGSIKPGP